MGLFMCNLVLEVCGHFFSYASFLCKRILYELLIQSKNFFETMYSTVFEVCYDKFYHKISHKWQTMIEYS